MQVSAPNPSPNDAPLSRLEENLKTANITLPVGNACPSLSEPPSTSPDVDLLTAEVKSHLRLSASSGINIRRGRRTLRSCPYATPASKVLCMNCRKDQPCSCRPKGKTADHPLEQLQELLLREQLIVEVVRRIHANPPPKMHIFYPDSDEEEASGSL